MSQHSTICGSESVEQLGTGRLEGQLRDIVLRPKLSLGECRDWARDCLGYKVDAIVSTRSIHLLE